MENNQNQKNTFFFSGKKMFTNHKGEQVERRVTLAAIIADNCMHIGATACGNADQFRRKFGQKIAFGRAMKKPIQVIKEISKNPGTVFKEFCLNYLETAE